MFDEFEIIDTYNSSIVYVVRYKLITLWFLDYNRSMGVFIIPIEHPPHPNNPIKSRSRNKRRNLWVVIMCILPTTSVLSRILHLLYTYHTI